MSGVKTTSVVNHQANYRRSSGFIWAIHSNSFFMFSTKSEWIVLNVVRCESARYGKRVWVRENVRGCCCWMLVLRSDSLSKNELWVPMDSNFTNGSGRSSSFFSFHIMIHLLILILLVLIRQRRVCRTDIIRILRGRELFFQNFKNLTGSAVYREKNRCAQQNCVILRP